MNICKDDVIGLVNTFDVMPITLVKDGMTPIALMWIIIVVSDVHFVHGWQNVAILATT